ncbi:MAG: hypothetical protein IT295_06645 [Dehalococcoidia bacterium]|nr:hypothetical protein [Dehalococcoidia bacterium]
MVESDKKLHIVVCLKSVLDPEGVNSYALCGRLEVDDSGRSFRSVEIPRIVNAYDEQAMEVALRLRDAGVDCRITALTVGPETSILLLRPAMAMGADDCVLIDDPETLCERPLLRPVDDLPAGDEAGCPRRQGSREALQEGRANQGPQPCGSRGRMTDPADYPAEKTTYALRSTDSVVRRATTLGPNVEVFAEKLFEGPLPWSKLRQGQKLLSWRFPDLTDTFLRPRMRPRGLTA